MTYSLINKCAKNYYNRTFMVPVIAKNVVTCFFLRHSVYIYIYIYLFIYLFKYLFKYLVFLFFIYYNKFVKH